MALEFIWLDEKRKSRCQQMREKLLFHIQYFNICFLRVCSCVSVCLGEEGKSREEEGEER
jgi:hypothetical protein